MITVSCARSLALLSLFVVGTASAAGDSRNSLADQVRAANDRFKNVAVAVSELIAVEYITSKGPAPLEGQLFNFHGAPNRYGLGPFYELHVWAWKPNPNGTFADMNPNVSCDHAAMK